MNCLIENEYIKGKKARKKNGKKRGKKTEKKTGKTWKKRGKKVGVLCYGGGGVINFSWELAYFIAGGLLTPCEH